MFPARALVTSRCAHHMAQQSCKLCKLVRSSKNQTTTAVKNLKLEQKHSNQILKYEKIYCDFFFIKYNWNYRRCQADLFFWSPPRKTVECLQKCQIKFKPLQSKSKKIETLGLQDFCHICDSHSKTTSLISQIGSLGVGS